MSAAGANIVVNGGFESGPALPNSGDNPGSAGDAWGIFASVPGWSGNPDVEIWSGNWGNAGQYTAYEGDRIAELDPFFNSEIFQVLTTTPGQLYEISFAYRRRHDDPAGLTRIGLLWNGVAIDQVQSTTTDWSVATYHVTADSASTEIRFQALGASNSYGDHIDAVSVAPIPEPSAGLLAATGALLLAGIRRFRARR